MTLLSRKATSILLLGGLSAILIAQTSVAEILLLDAPARSSSVDSYISEDVTPYDFIVAPVERIKREINFKRVIHVDGRVRSETYEMSSDTSREEAMDWYREELLSAGGEIVFECEARDCGRAAIWGGSIFKLRVLSAFDSKQHYLAAALKNELSTELFSIYVVERGNQKVYAHVVQVSVDGEVDLGTNQDFSAILARHGQVVVEGVVPDRQGELNDDALERLKALTDELVPFTENIYVVCHVYGSRSSELLLEQSQSCAESAAQTLNDEADIEVIPFGAGPLAPLQGGIPQSRVEIVVPALLRREP